MKKVLFAILAVAFFSSCTKEWEYKTVALEGQSITKYSSNEFQLPDSTLNAMGKDGWELATSYTAIETTHPNFGNEEYVTGLQPNVRTSSIVFVFKRCK